MRKNKKLILIILSIYSANLFGCKWCKKWKNNESKKQEEANKEDKNNFYKDYLAKFYPKALIINDYFSEMCPTAIDLSLKDLLKILSNEEWFYYQNKPKGFKAGEFWEITLNQCEKIKVFLNSAIVNDKNQIILQKSNFVFDENPNNDITGEKLLFFFKKNGFTTYQYFYAEYADRLTKLINEGLRNFDLIKAQIHHSNLCSILEHLRDFPLYNTYEEVIKKQKELISILKSKLGIATYNNANGKTYEF